MKKKILWIVLSLAVLICLVVTVSYFINARDGISSADKQTIKSLFSDSAYLNSQSGKSISIQGSNSCQEIWDASDKYGWSKGTPKLYFDGGSGETHYWKSGMPKSFDVFCKYDMSKGGYTGAGITVN